MAALPKVLPFDYLQFSSTQVAAAKAILLKGNYLRSVISWQHSWQMLLSCRLDKIYAEKGWQGKDFRSI